MKRKGKVKGNDWKKNNSYGIISGYKKGGQKVLNSFWTSM